MKLIHQSILVLISIMLFSSCSTLYKPNTVYSPMLTEKGELNLLASGSIVGSSLLNVQAAYAVSDRFAVMGNFMYHSHRSYFGRSRFDRKEKLRIYSGEAGVGYNLPLDSKGMWFSQWYGGGGYGSSSDRIDYLYEPDPEVSANYYNFFFQPGGFFRHRSIEMGIDVRANYVHMYNFNAFQYEYFNWWNSGYIFSNNSTLSFMLIEPAFTFRFGGKNLKSVFQIGLTLPVLDSDAYYAVHSPDGWELMPVKMSVGITYTFRKKKPVLNDNQP